MPEPKLAKNRQHFDLRAVGALLDEVERLVGCGAQIRSRSDDHVLMSDPEGNEFCVEP